MKVSELLIESEELLPLVVKLQKGSSLSSTKDLTAILDKLPGWKVEKKVVAKQIHAYDMNREIEDMFRPLRPAAIGGREDMVINISGNKDEIAALTEQYEKMVKDSVKELPAKMKADAIYIMNISKIKPHPKYEQLKCFEFELYFTSRGYEVTSPDGKTFMLGKVPRYISLDFSGLYRWMKEKTTFDADLIEVFGDHSPAKRKLDQVELRAKTMENTGHCQICSGVQKMNRGKMVNHGFTRPGYGYIVGNCFGVNALPYEKSSDTCTSYIDVLKDYLNTTEHTIARLKGPSTKSLRVGSGKHAHDVKIGDPDWEKTLASAIAGQESQKRQIEGDIEYYKKRIKNWKEVQFAWEKK